MGDNGGELWGRMGEMIDNSRVSSSFRNIIIVITLRYASCLDAGSPSEYVTSTLIPLANRGKGKKTNTFNYERKTPFLSKMDKIHFQIYRKNFLNARGLRKIRVYSCSVDISIIEKYSVNSSRSTRHLEISILI